MSQVPPDPLPARVRSFERFAWAALAYTLGVILFGAVVRITGSGAGCGQHWPTCHGEVAHLPQSTETAIELTHRATSGLSLVAVVALLALALGRFESGHAARRFAKLSVLFMLVESLVGAALVLLELVGKNDSMARAIVMAVHLVNTCLLTGAMALTAWCASRPAPLAWRPRSGLEWRLLGGLIGVVLVSMTGAVTALGDTLYPVQAGDALATRVLQPEEASFLERGRAVHPLMALLLAVYLLRALWGPVETPGALGRVRRWVVALVGVQLTAGVVNIWLFAPGWMQVTHLGIANLLFLALLAAWAIAAARPHSQLDQPSASGPGRHG